MLRYQRLKCESDAYLPFLVTHLQSELPSLGDALTGKRKGSIDGWLSADIRNCIAVVCIKHIEYDSPFSDVISYLKKGTWVTIGYLEGNWRDGYQRFPNVLLDRAGCRKELTWDDEIINGLLCSFWSNDIDSAIKISQWVDEDLIEDSYFESNVMDAWMIVLLGKFIPKNTLSGCEPIVNRIRNSKRRRAKLFLNILESIDQKKQDILLNTVTDYIKFFNKNEADNSLPLDLGCISRMASLLWEVARYSGIALPDIPEDIMDRIITRKSIGLEQ